MQTSKKETKKQTFSRSHLYKITATGILIALAMVTKLATGFSIPVLGPGGMKVGFSGIFTALPAFLFGPIYGGVASALSDLIGVLVKPDGAYIPWLTVCAFFGGCVKGLLWQWLKKAATKKGGAVLLTAFLLIGALGVSSFAFLQADGVVSSLITTKETVPTKDEVANMSLSPLSTLATKLAMYQNDTLTMTKAPEGDEIVMPSKAMVGEFAYNVKKIGAGVFKDHAEGLVVILPSTVTGIDASAFGDLKNVTIRCLGENETVSKFCKEKGYTFEVIEGESASITVASGSDLSGEGYAFSTNDTYRKYLSGYLNFMTFGLCLIAIVGLATSCVLLVFSKKPEMTLLLRCAIACIVSGLLVTTINTGILQQFLAAYQGRAFLILWIPRAVEELVVCFIQSYVIFLLMGIYEKRIAPKMLK